MLVFAREAGCPTAIQIPNAQCVVVVLQEYVNGQLKNKFGDAFIRGNNGEVVWPAQKHVC